jgi:pyruvate dehydrogenase E2 component (dihydrolipoamide acetyltransferase)
MAEDIYTFNLPDIGEGVVEGEVVEWLKKEGDSVKQDEPVVIVMTDKATVELPSPFPGVLSKQYYQPGQIAIKDKPLYDLRLEGAVLRQKTEEPKPSVPAIEEEKKRSSTAEERSIDQPSRAAEEKTSSKMLATPKVRRLAAEMGMDLAKISGSGPEGRVLPEDLKKNALTSPAAPLIHFEDDEEQPLIGIRGMMAKKMDQGKARLSQFSYFEQVDVTRLIQLRQNMKEKAAQEGIHLSYMPFFVRALTMTIRQYPVINSSVDLQSGKILLHKQHNIGIAIASPQGLIVPVLKGVQEMNLEEIIRAYETLKSKALAGKLAPNDHKDATITLSNFGVLGGEGLWATPMISDPEVAILAVARIHKAPVVKSEEIVVRDILPLSWSFDHRIIDGELAAVISHYYSTLLRDPAFLL